ncbi:HTH-type transcriptional regulator BhcR [Dasania marina]|uniref:HTH-type transcriptional regulator BhcR n=1 Tax=Dasania marina TaxID=471499 RepID=UPI0030DCFFF9
MSNNNPKRPRGRPRSAPAQTEPNTIQALDRGLGLLRDLAQAGNATLTDLALRNNMPASTTHRVLSTLDKHGFVEFDESNQEWLIGIEAFRIGSAYLERTNLIEAARKTMRNLMEETGETANLGIADEGDVVFVSQIETHNPIRAFFRPGTRGLMHSSGIGKALLADMSKREVSRIISLKGLPQYTDNTLAEPESLFADLALTGSRGWSFDNEERYLGMRCVASNIYNNYGEAIAGISVSGPANRFSEQSVAEFGPRVKQAANEVTLAIGGKIPKANLGPDSGRTYY